MTNLNGFTDTDRIDFATTLYDGSRIDTLAEAMGLSREAVVLSLASGELSGKNVLENQAQAIDSRLEGLRDEYTALLRRIDTIRAYMEAAGHLDADAPAALAQAS